jgi:hypothetical protein
MFQTNFVEKIKTHILCSVTFFFENRAVYEKTWKNIVQRGSLHVTKLSTRIASWTPKAIDILSEYVIILAFPL